MFVKINIEKEHFTKAQISTAIWLIGELIWWKKCNQSTN